MENIDELKKEAKDAIEKVKKDIGEVREILRKIAGEAKGVSKAKLAERLQWAERRIEDTAQRVESRIEQAVAMMTKSPTAESSTGSGSVVTREMDFTDFINVEVSHAFKVEIIRSDSYRVALTASEKYLEHIDVIKSGNTLKISLKALRFHVRPTLEARIAMPALNKLRLSGATRGTVKGFGSQESFDLNLSGASRLQVEMKAGETKLEVSGASRLSGNMEVGDTEFTFSGASRAELSGSANNTVLNAWGASKLALADFAINDASVNLKGASQAVVNVNGKLDLDLSGASRLNYIGNPTLRDINVSGAATLSQR